MRPEHGVAGEPSQANPPPQPADPAHRNTRALIRIPGLGIAAGGKYDSDTAGPRLMELMFDDATHHLLGNRPPCRRQGPQAWRKGIFSPVRLWLALRPVPTTLRDTPAVQGCGGLVYRALLSSGCGSEPRSMALPPCCWGCTVGHCSRSGRESGRCRTCCWPMIGPWAAPMANRRRSERVSARPRVTPR